MANKSKKNLPDVRIRNSTAEFLIFSYQTGGDGVEVRVQNGTVWLSQKNMGLLFDTSSDNVGLHLKNIFADGELQSDSVTEDFSVTAADNKNYRDLVRSRWNMEIQDLQSAVKGYIKGKKMNIPLLVRYAELFSVAKIIRRYLEVLL